MKGLLKIFIVVGVALMIAGGICLGVGIKKDVFARNTVENSYTIEDDFPLVSPTREGYTFTGWVSSSSEAVPKISKGMTGNLVLTATWNDGNTYNVNFLLRTDQGFYSGGLFSFTWDR